MPNIQDVPIHSLTPELSAPFFDSLNAGYPATSDQDGFDEWFRRKAREDRRAWVYRESAGQLGAICIYQVQHDEVINDAGTALAGAALKLCTFKVGEAVRGRKVGELFLKAAFRFATDNACEHVFITAQAADQSYLIGMLADFGFEEQGQYRGDLVLVKTHPVQRPEPTAALPPPEYVRRFFPHYRADATVQKFLVPIQPQFHEILFPDYATIQAGLFGQTGSVGNAIKLAYLCHASTKAIRAGDVMLFYRSGDEKSVTSVGVVEQFEVSADATAIATLVSRRTVYSLSEIDDMAKKPTKVVLFRLIRHFDNPVTYDSLIQHGIVAGSIRSIQKISDDAFSKVLVAAGR